MRLLKGSGITLKAVTSHKLRALLAFGVSAVVGIFFGAYPARRAARLDPIVALRAE